MTTRGTNGGPKPEVNIPLAMELKADGLTWREVAAVLTEAVDRRVPFQPQSVQGACRRHRRALERAA
jgi:hypothetical protein